MFLDKLTTFKVEIFHNQLGTWPCREFPERSRSCSFDMFFRNTHEIVPLRFLEERLTEIIREFEQFKDVWNEEMLNPGTNLKAFERSFWSVLVLLHEDSARTSKERRRNTERGFILLHAGCWFLL